MYEPWRSLRESWDLASKLSSTALIALNRLCRDNSGKRNAAIQRTGFGNRQAASIVITVTLYFQSVRSYYGYYLHSERHKALCDRRYMCFFHRLHFDTVYPEVCECALVCACVSVGVPTCPFFWPSLLLSRHARGFCPLLSDPHLSLPYPLLQILHLQSQPSLILGFPPVPHLLLVVVFHPHILPHACLFYACWSYFSNLFHCHPFLPNHCATPLILLSSYSLSDSPGKTCWLSYPYTHTMFPSLLSRQQQMQPHQFHPFKRLKIEGEQVEWLSFLYGECWWNTKVGLLWGGKVEAQDIVATARGLSRGHLTSTDPGQRLTSQFLAQI